MKKAIIWQVVMTVIVLATYFIILQLTGDKETASVAVVAVAFASVAVAFASVAVASVAVVVAAFVAFASSSVAVAVAFVAVASIASVAVVVAVAFVAVAVAVASDLGISTKKAVVMYSIQFTAVLAIILLF